MLHSPLLLAPIRSIMEAIKITRARRHILAIPFPSSSSLTHTMDYIASLLQDDKSTLIPLLSQLFLAYREIGTNLRENAYSSEKVVPSS